MKHVILLKILFGKHLNWHGSRLTFLSLFIISMLQERRVNLTQISNGFATKGKKSGKVRRTEDFFRKFEINYDDIARVLSSFIENISKWTLTMDRTNWKIGKVNINILYLAVAYKSIAIPLFWSLLQTKDDTGELYTKRGNSSTEERIEIIDRFIKVFGVDRIEVLTGDREFIGRKWFDYLEKKGINFCIREKKSKLITYSQRWEIETMFKAFKSQGFNLEDTHLTKKDRIEKLLALMAIAFVWSYISGEFFERVEPIKLKKN